MSPTASFTNLPSGTRRFLPDRRVTARRAHRWFCRRLTWMQLNILSVLIIVGIVAVVMVVDR